MLFSYAQAGRDPFWMYRCKIALDILWLDKSRRIVEQDAARPRHARAWRGDARRRRPRQRDLRLRATGWLDHPASACRGEGSQHHSAFGRRVMGRPLACIKRCRAASMSSPLVIPSRSKGLKVGSVRDLWSSQGAILSKKKFFMLKAQGSRNVGIYRNSVMASIINKYCIRQYSDA